MEGFLYNEAVEGVVSDWFSLVGKVLIWGFVELMSRNLEENVDFAKPLR